MIAAKMAKLKHGEAGNGRKVDGANAPSTNASAAATLNVSSDVVKRAKAASQLGRCD
jgi:hypothetical protein